MNRANFRLRLLRRKEGRPVSPIGVVVTVVVVLPSLREKSDVARMLLCKRKRKLLCLYRLRMELLGRAEEVSPATGPTRNNVGHIVQERMSPRVSLDSAPETEHVLNQKKPYGT